LHSNYCYDIEITRALEKHNQGLAVVIPIILRPCDWHDTEFAKIQALPKNAKPVKSFADEDEAFLSITEGIKAAISNLKKKTDIPTTEVIGVDTTIKPSKKLKAECDIPPNIFHWVGRKKEIFEIDRDLQKVVFISGIGGQGKSGLASYYVKEVAPKKGYWEFWDWRDCQEKEHRIHTKIISIISDLLTSRS